MGIIFFTKLVLETLKPYRYRGLTQRSLTKTLLYFLSISLVYLLIIGAVNAPRYYENYANAGSNVSGLEKFSINIDLETKTPVVVSKTPRIVIDTSDNRSLQPKEDVLITKDKIYSKVLFWTKKTDYSEYDIMSNISKIKKSSFFLILVFIPSLLVISYLITLVKYFAIVLLFGAIASVLVIIQRNRVTIFEVFKSAVYSLTVYYLANIVSSIFGIKFLGVIIYTIFFVVVLFFMKSDGEVTDSIIGDE